jgi:protein-L-isoaspartate O-methyltransferase
MNVFFSGVLFYILFSPIFAVGLEEDIDQKSNTSITDTVIYTDFCKDATEDNSIFEEFKSSEILINVMQHVSYELGLEYEHYIFNCYPQLLDLSKDFHQNDEIGMPKTYYFELMGDYFSPTNLRYIKIAGDIQEIFGDLNGKRIAEIGSGYGGQSKILSDIYENLTFILFDLPEPLNLASKYLETLGVYNVETKNIESLESVENEFYDFVISNYAFSECSKEVQDMYIEKVIKISKSGYMIYNQISGYGGIISYSKEEMAEILNSMGFSVNVLPEEPCSHPDNFLIIWNS